MAEVIQIEDNHDLVSTSKYKYAKWTFDKFNPVQSRLIEFYNSNSNIAIAASTSAGKTVCSEMYLAYEIKKRGGKGIYVGPLKALAKEKEQEWSEKTHHFSDIKTFIATGDFRFTEKRLKEMDEASLVVMTPEMLASRCRNHKSDKSKFLKDVGTIVFDESHLLTVPSRGDHIEVALMKLVEINPDVRIVLLSATMPNVNEICGWISNLTKKDTYYLESNYRPCPLNIHYENYYDGDRTYDDKEAQKIGTACAIVEYYNEDKFLIFVHSKRTGQQMIDSLARYGVEAEFHSADLQLKDRLSLEERFKNDKTFRVLVATSTLAWGLNLPARRVIVTGVTRGLLPVENYDIQQMIGRAGRPKYDPCGDAYILIPESEKDYYIHKLKKKEPIKSTLLEYVGKENNKNYKTLAFHIVSEIHQGNIKTKECFENWLKNSLAYFQDKNFDEEIIEITLKKLQMCGAIYLDDNDQYKCSAVGRIASMMYYSPFDVSDLRKNFNKLFEENRQEDDHMISFALGNIDSYKFGICNKQEKEVIKGYKNKMEKINGVNFVGDEVLKIGCSYFNMMRGIRNVNVLNSTNSLLLSDLERTIQVINALDTMSCKWDRKDWIRTLGLRIRYGVEKDLVDLCQIPNIGRARAKRLKEKRIKNVSEFIQLKPEELSKIMKCSLKLTQEALSAAQEINLRDSIQ